MLINSEFDLFDPFYLLLQIYLISEGVLYLLILNRQTRILTKNHKQEIKRKTGSYLPRKAAKSRFFLEPRPSKVPLIDRGCFTGLKQNFVLLCT